MMKLSEVLDRVNKGEIPRLQSKEYAAWLNRNKGYVTINQLQESTNGKWALLMSYKNPENIQMIFHFLSNEEIEKTRDRTWIIEYLQEIPIYVDTDNVNSVMPNFHKWHEQRTEEKKMKKETCQFEVMWKGTATILFRNGKRVSVAKVHDEKFNKTKGLLMCIWKMKFTYSHMKSTLRRRNLKDSQKAELATLYERVYAISHLDDNAIKNIVKSAKKDKKRDCWYAEF